jgi:hypothetical protein
MPDPRVLYVVTAVVVLALVVWVIVVLARPAGKPLASSGAVLGHPSNAPSDAFKDGDPPEKAARPAKSEATQALSRSRPRLDSHLEIQDHAEDSSDEKHET